MILLSALLASLTGLVAGERPVERAQVELSAVVAAVQPAVARASTPAHVRVAAPVVVRPVLETRAPARMGRVPGVRAILSVKQSWLH